MVKGLAQKLELARELWDWEATPGQLAFLSLSLPGGVPPKVVAIVMGRRAGKTEGMAMDAATDMLLDPDLGQMIVAPTKDQAETLFDAIEEKILTIIEDDDKRAAWPAVDDWEIKRSPYPHIRRKSDHQVILSARSAGRNGANLRGKGTTRKIKRFKIRCDEAAFIPDSVFTQVLAPMLATVPGGGQLMMASSPYGKRGYFYESYLRGERCERGYRSVRLPSSSNPLVDADYLAEMAETCPARTFEAEYLAMFVDAAGAVFAGEDIEGCRCDDDYGLSPLIGVRYVAGVDFGRRGDYTVVSIGACEGNRVRVVQLVRVRGLGWAAQVAQICDVLAAWGVVRVVPDRTGIGDAVCEQLEGAIATRRIRCEIEEFLFTSAGKGYLMDALSMGLNRRALAYPAHPVLLSELANYEVVGTTAGGRDKMEARTGHDDTVCALALMYRAASPYLLNTGIGNISQIEGRNEAEKMKTVISASNVTTARRGGFQDGDDNRCRNVHFSAALPSGLEISGAQKQISRVLGNLYQHEAARRLGASLKRIL